MSSLENKYCEGLCMESVPRDPILILSNVSTIFPNGNGGLQALDDISFSVCPEEFVCVLGPSGCGKTTLLRALAGLRPPTHGQILFRGGPLLQPSKDMGLVFQKANLMPWRTVLENITLPLELRNFTPDEMHARANDLVQLVGLGGFEDTLPRDLSGGMAQRVAIARALVHDPDVLLLDEPLGSLDALTRERMGSELLHIWQMKRKTVVMVTHSITEALYLADRVIVLSRRPGRLRLDLQVDLPRPRDEEIQYTPQFGRLAHTLRAAIE
jgi:NitT/TauT family transport system ATP-binding protein